MGCGQWTSIASRLRVEPPVADKETRRMRAVDGYCLQQGAGVCFCSLTGYHEKSIEDSQANIKTMTAPQPVATSRRA